MKLTQDQQKQLAMALVAVAVFGYVYFARMLTPVQAEIKKKEIELSGIQSRIDGLRVTANQRDQLLKRVEELKTQVAKVEKRLPKETNLQDIIRIVSDLAAKNGVRFSSFAPMGEQVTGLFKEISFAMNINGSVSSIGRFLSIIGQQERIFSARNLSLNYTPDEKRNETVSGSFTLISFVYNG